MRAPPEMFSADHLISDALAFLAGCVISYVLMLAALRRLRSIERALQDRERQFRKVIDSSSDAVVLSSLDLITVYATPSCEAVLGYRPDELVGTEARRTVHPDDMHLISEAAQTLMSGGATSPIRVRVRHGDGRWIWVEAVSRFIPGEGRTADLFYSASRDVTSRVQIEDELAARERSLRAILDRALDPIIGTDNDNRVAEWNHAAEVLFGWTYEEAIGSHASMLIPMECQEEFSQNMEIALGGDESGRAHPFESRFVCKDGHEVPVELTVWSVEEASRKLVMGVVRDISVRKETEEALIAARENALEASRLKSEFLATMSHEIRTPMNGVIGLSEVLLDTELDSSQREYALGIARAGSALMQVINDILDFSKLEAGKIVLEEVVFDVAALVEEVVDLVAGSARAKGLELIGDCAPDVPRMLYGDPSRLRQVLLNLASNAVKFTEHGEIIVRAGRVAEQETAADAARSVVSVRFEVVDTGTGIAESAQKKIFDVFTQADTSTTRRYGGTGLGLAISRSIVEAMNGRIRVHSTPGQGSTFQVEIPLRRALVTGPTEHGDGGEPDLTGLRVLVVDGNETARLVLDRWLRTWNIRPTAAADAQQALDQLRAAAQRDKPFHVAILDLATPGMDGLELCAHIREDQSISRIALIIMSSAGAVDHAAVTRLGLVTSLIKPVHQAQLRASMVEAMAAPAAVPSPVEATRPQPQPAAGPQVSPAAQRVLIAEDNEINQRVGVAMLASMGYRTEVAGSGVEALDQAARALAAGAPFDVILMDVQMPEMDGLAATAELRRREGTKRHTPVIALTAAARAEDRQRCLAAGMDDFLSKPFNRAGLTEILSRWVSGDGGTDGGADRTSGASRRHPGSGAPPARPDRGSARW